MKLLQLTGALEGAAVWVNPAKVTCITEEEAPWPRHTVVQCGPEVRIHVKEPAKTVAAMWEKALGS